MEKLISFDVWDTILKRKCLPEEVKLFTSRYIWLKYHESLKKEYDCIYSILIERNRIEKEMAKENQKQGKDDEYRILDVLKELQKKIFISKLDITKELLKVEIEYEKEITYVNPDILPILEEYKNLKKCCISDFYMGESNLKEIINSKKLGVKFSKIYSSADYLQNKRSGNLFITAEQELKIDGTEHIHVGDNLYSDIQKAQELGIKTISILNNENQVFCPDRKRPFYFGLDKLKKNSKKEVLYDIGLDLSPILYFYVHYIIEYAIRNHIPKIYYFTREGEVFIKIHELMKQNNPFGVKLPECELLEVSRMSTFGSSLKEFCITELLRLWSQYRIQSIKAMFKTLNIELKEYLPYFKKYKIDVEEEIISPWFDIRIQALFKEEEFKNKIQAELETKKAEILTYMKKKGIENDDTPMFIVDIGWRGTIQDNLAYIFPNKKITGFYFSLFDFYNLQPANTVKIGYITNPDKRDKIVNPLITILETLFTPDSGSVTEYKEGRAIRKVKQGEMELAKDYINPIQKGMLEGSKKINEYHKLHPYENNEFIEYVESLLTHLKQEPPRELVEVYYKLIHNETFGTGDYIDKNGKLSLIDKMNLGKCKDLLRNENWKESFLLHNNMNVFKVLLQGKATLRKIIQYNKTKKGLGD